MKWTDELGRLWNVDGSMGGLDYRASYGLANTDMVNREF